LVRLSVIDIDPAGDHLSGREGYRMTLANKETTFREIGIELLIAIEMGQYFGVRRKSEYSSSDCPIRGYVENRSRKLA
jgi:hypothetical protein